MSGTDTANYLSLMLQEQSVLLDLNQVEIVVQLPILQRVPHSEEAFVGLLNYHGSSLPVFSLLQLVTPHTPEKLNLDTPLVLCQLQNQHFGLLVTEVKEVLQVNETDFQKTHLTKIKCFVRGVLSYETKAYWVLDLKKLVQNHHLELTSDE